MTFYPINEAVPGPRWRALFEATWPGYRAWYLQEGESARPELRVASEQLERHMPELVPTWQRLVQLVDGDPTAARMLTMWNPPRFLPGCSQAALVGESPLLVRNYDYLPDLCERVIYTSAFTGRRVIGTSDCLWGLLDGMNDAGLAASLTFGGGRGTGPGFGIPLVMRYLLEVAGDVTEAISVLRRLPVTMTYNVTLLDAAGTAATVYLAPDAPAEVTAQPVATNHRGTRPDHPEHARRYRSVERQRLLLELLDADPTPAELRAAFLRPPLHNVEYAQGFGTIYTAAYRPAEGVVDYVWRGSSWRRTFDSVDATHVALLRPNRPTRAA
jgi:predicted choloylglycine hydrolase